MDDNKEYVSPAPPEVIGAAGLASSAAAGALPFSDGSSQYSSAD